MILVVSRMALSLPRWQSSDNLATKINSDREGGGGRFANGLSAGTSRSSGCNTCRTAPSAPRSTKTNLYRHSSDNASRSASATAASDCLARTLPGASALKPTRACSVKRDRLEVKPMAHMVYRRRFSSMAYWRLLRRVGGVWASQPRLGPTSRSSAKTRRVLVWIYRREWAAYLSFRSRAAPRRFLAAPKIASVCRYAS